MNKTEMRRVHSAIFLEEPRLRHVPPPLRP
jgi:hypothetical protein